MLTALTRDGQQGDGVAREDGHGVLESSVAVAPHGKSVSQRDGLSGQRCRAALTQNAGAAHRTHGMRRPDMMPLGSDTSPGRARDLAEQARRAWTLFGAGSRRGRDGRRDDDDDDDLPRPSAIVTLFPLFGLAAPPLPA